MNNNETFETLMDNALGSVLDLIEFKDIPDFEKDMWLLSLCAIIAENVRPDRRADFFENFESMKAGVDYEMAKNKHS